MPGSAELEEARTHKLPPSDQTLSWERGPGAALSSPEVTETLPKGWGRQRRDSLTAVTGLCGPEQAQKASAELSPGDLFLHQTVEKQCPFLPQPFSV